MIMQLVATAGLSLAISTTYALIARSRSTFGIRVAFVLSISCLSSTLLYLFGEVDRWTVFLSPLINVLVFLPVWIHIGQVDEMAHEVRHTYLRLALMIVIVGVGSASFLLAIALVTTDDITFVYGGVGAVLAVYLPSLAALLIFSVCLFHRR